MTPTNSFLKKIVSLIGIALAVFVFWEICARLYLAFSEHSAAFLIYGFAPVQKRWVEVSNEEGGILYYKRVPSTDPADPVNSLGMRGGDILPEHPNVTRIVCLGGSTTYGTGLPYADTYPLLLQQQLDKRFRKGCFEVINAGQPGMEMSHILSLTKKTVIALRPDIVLLMSINNNFKSVGHFYVGFKGGLKNNSQHFTVRHLALGRIVKNIIDAVNKNKLHDTLANYDWVGLSESLSSSDNIWQEKYEQRLDVLCETLLSSNPDMKIVLLEQAINVHDFSPMEKPFDIAKHVLRNKSAFHPKIYTLDVHSAIIAAANQGVDVWQNPEWDPLHLKKAGNLIIAREICKFIDKHNNLQVSQANREK